MMVKRVVWIAMLCAMFAVAGCGGKKAVDEAPPAEPSAPPTEQVQETPTDLGGSSAPEEVAPVSVNDVYFDFDSYNLTSEAKGTLEVNAREMKRVTTGNVTVEGHCDERGTRAYNLALGEKRANAAKDYLVSMGVDASRINTVSYGKERPFDDGHDESAWAKNRRAHFVAGE